MYQLISKKMSKKRKGFTLIELVVVIAILGILAAIAIPRLSSSRDGAEQTAHEANIRTIESAVGLYQAETGDLPTSIEQLTPKYLQSIPDNPVTGTSEGYVLTGTAPDIYVIGK